MIPALAAVALAARLANPDGLEAAQDAFARADYARAEALALDAARPPREGAALYLAGLARFRGGRPDAALRALDQARRAADPPAAGAWAFNRASCLYELGRFAEAEQAWLAAAEEDPSLASLSLVNAGWAALDGGAPARARELVDRARASGRGNARELVEELVARLDALPGADAAEAVRPGAAAATPPPGRHLQAALRLGGAYDTNPLQAGLIADPQLPTTSQVGSPAVVVGAALAWRSRLWGEATGQLSYAVDELALLQSDAEDRSLQNHALSAALEVPVGARIRLGALAGGQLAFTGRSRFRELEGDLGIAAWGRLEEAEITSTRLDLAWTHKAGHGDEFSYLSGDRIELGLAQALRIGRVSVEALYRLRLERIGTLLAPADQPNVGCLGSLQCDQQFVIPFGYTGQLVQLAGRARPLSRLRIEGTVGLEWRQYLEDGYLLLTATPWTGPPISPIARRRRDDQTAFARLGASCEVLEWLAVSLRYDFVRNRSNVDSLHASDPANWNYDKHVLTLETVVTW